MHGHSSDQPVTRRGVIGLTAAAVWGGPSVARRLRPAPADEFVASVGLCVHLSSPPYSEMFNKVLHCTRDLGVRHLRDDLRPSDDLKRWRALFSKAGVRAHLLVSPATNTPAEMMDYILALDPGGVSAIEGQNEGDSSWFRAQPSARPNWDAAVVAYQREIFTAVRARFPATALPVVSPTVLDYEPGDMLALRAAAPFTDIVALHAYVQEEQEPETTDPYAALGWYLRKMRDGFKPDAPVMITEAGYRTGPTGVSDRAAAIYLPRLLLNAFDQGILRSFIYELFDEGTDAADPEPNYGLLRSDGTPKPAYHALRILLNELTDPGPAFEPAPIEIGVEHARPGVRLISFAKRDGRHILAVWRARSVWDRRRRRDIPVRSELVGFVFGRPPRGLATRVVYPQNDWQQIPAKQEINVTVSEFVTMVRIDW